MDLFRDIYGDGQPEDRIAEILRKGAPVIPTRVGTIPDKRPVTTAASRKEEVRALIEQNLATTNFNQETLDSLADAMSSYLENCIGQTGQR